MILVVWAFGGVAALMGWDRSLGGWAEARLTPPRPTVAEIAARFGSDDPRTTWFAETYALHRAALDARSGPQPIDPDTAGTAAWIRLPGIGPRTAAAIVSYRESHGGLNAPADLLAVSGVGPVTLGRVAPYLRWKVPSGVTGALRGGTPKPSLNAVDSTFLVAIDGIGPRLATIILRARRTGGFRSWDDVRAVSGVGVARLAALKESTRLGRQNARGGMEPSETHQP